MSLVSISIVASYDDLLFRDAFYDNGIMELLHALLFNDTCIRSMSNKCFKIVFDLLMWSSGKSLGLV